MKNRKHQKERKIHFAAENAKRLEDEWNDTRLDPLVKQVVMDAALYARTKWNWDFAVTEIYRTIEEITALQASGVHGEWRAIDVRTNNQDPEAVADVFAYINTRYAYDPARPALRVCFKESHGKGTHAHFQVHPYTIERSENQTSDYRIQDSGFGIYD